MRAQEMIIIGCVLIAAGLLFLVLSQYVLSRWHKKVLSEL